MKLKLRQLPQIVLPSGETKDLALRDAAILIWLALEGPTARVRLAKLIWPQGDAGNARNALRQRIFQLHKLLGSDLIFGKSILSLAEGVEHDLDASATTLLGETMYDHDSPFQTWLTQQRLQRATRVGTELAQRVDASEAAGRLDEALYQAQQLLFLEPLSEAAHRRVIRLHYLRNDRSAALLAFDRCEQVLKHEVGVCPSIETLALLQLMETSERPSSLLPAPLVPASVLRPPQLIGRVSELRALLDGLTAKGVSLLMGMAGIGKSRLLASVVDADPGDGLLAISARLGDSVVPYALANRLVMPLLQRTNSDLHTQLRLDLTPVIPEWCVDQSEHPLRNRTRLSNAMRLLLSESSASGLHGVVIDDLQYADNASVDLLRSLVGQGSCGWILAMRPDELGDSAMALIEDQSASTSTRVMQLQSLNLEEVNSLLDSFGIAGIGGVNQANSLHRRTGGIPLYMLETVKAAVRNPGQSSAKKAEPFDWPKAENVLRLIQRRLYTLTPLALKLARCAAVAGQDLTSPLAASVLGLQPLDLVDAWAELESAQVLRDTSFAHDLIAEATLNGVPAAVVRPLHGAIAEFLESSQGDASRIAEHWIASGELQKAVPHLMESAKRARAILQCDEAAQHFQRAGLQAGRRVAAFDAYFLAAESLSENTFDQRIAQIGKVLTELAVDDGQLAMAALVPALLHVEAGRSREAKALLQEALPKHIVPGPPTSKPSCSGACVSCIGNCVS